MKLYVRMVRPVLSYPSPHYEPKYEELEPDGIWYHEDDIPRLKEKYKHYETTFENVVFMEKYRLLSDKEVERILQWGDIPTVP